MDPELGYELRVRQHPLRVISRVDGRGYETEVVALEDPSWLEPGTGLRILEASVPAHQAARHHRGKPDDDHIRLEGSALVPEAKEDLIQSVPADTKVEH